MTRREGLFLHDVQKRIGAIERRNFGFTIEKYGRDIKRMVTRCERRLKNRLEREERKRELVEGRDIQRHGRVVASLRRGLRVRSKWKVPTDSSVFYELRILAQKPARFTRADLPEIFWRSYIRTLLEERTTFPFLSYSRLRFSPYIRTNTHEKLWMPRVRKKKMNLWERI